MDLRALHTAAPPVNDANLAKPRVLCGFEIGLHDGPGLSGSKEMQIDELLDRDLDGIRERALVVAQVCVRIIFRDPGITHRPLRNGARFRLFENSVPMQTGTPASR